MRPRTTLLAVGLFAFLNGASLDDQLRRPGLLRDCRCMSASCRIVSTVEHPPTSLSRPLATIDLLRTASWQD